MMAAALIGFAVMALLAVVPSELPWRRRLIDDRRSRATRGSRRW
ncbi:hypothetical protein BF49_4512 [Bradyrhizobium sp.]|nr:hypothetical protein BF49_4512 [Bradyrhizobium sp.]